MNRQRMLQVRQAILDHKDKFLYCATLSRQNSPARQLLDAECNTCGCVAGFACALFSPEKVRGCGIELMASSQLELTPEESLFLFFCRKQGWDNEPYHSLSTSGYEAAIERIDFLLAREESLS